MKNIIRILFIVFILFTNINIPFGFATNLVSNGGFESGYDDFSSNYTQCTEEDDLVNEGYYAVDTSPDSEAHHYRSDGAFTAVPYEGTQFFMANGSNDATDVVWTPDNLLSVVEADTAYRFEAYLCSLVAVGGGMAAPNLVFKLGDGTTDEATFVDLVTITQPQPTPTTAGTWYLVYADGKFDTTGNYYLRLVNNQTAAGGNDFGLDAVYFGFSSEAPTVDEYPVDDPATYDTSGMDVVPNIDTDQASYTVTELLDNEVGSTFDGGILQEDVGGRTVVNVFTVLATDGTIDTNGNNLTISGDITGSGSLTKTGTGALTLSGNASNTKGMVASAGTLVLSGANTYTGNTTINADGTLQIGSGGTTGSLSTSSAITNNGTLSFNRSDTITQGTNFASVISGSGAVTQSGTGTLVLSGANTYTGNTTINADGTLQIGSGGTTGSLSTSSAITNNGTLSFNRSDTITQGTNFASVISGSGAVTQSGTGTLVLSGANTYSGTTTIDNGSIVANNSSALGTGAVTNNATLNVGTTNVSGIAKYTQADNSTLAVTVANPSSAGKLSSATAADVSTASTVAVTIPSGVYISNGTTFTVIDTTAGGNFNVPGTITSTDSRIAFTGSSSSGDLMLTVNRSSTGFASTAKDPNAKNAGTVLDNVTSPSSDMGTILNTMECLNASQLASGLDTVVPEANSGVLNTSTSSLNDFIGISIERTKNILRIAANSSFGAITGISAGDEQKLSAIWGKSYGGYLDQGARKGIEGYNAWNAGTAIGFDRLLFNLVTLGISGGWAYGNVDSDINNGNTYINSAQSTIYGGYRNDKYPFFIDLSGSFAWNWYNGRRDIAVSTIQRRANAEYDGQQYSAYIDAGYDINITEKTRFTPLLSLQWNHLHLESYTETEAGALNLDVKKQDYDMLQSGVGFSMNTEIDSNRCKIIPEIHAKWLYDFFGEAVEMTSAFTGGGASFATNGAKPARNSFNIGGQLGIDLKNNVSILIECDTELKDEFFGIYGAATVRYSF